MHDSQHCQPVSPLVDKLPIEKTGEAPVRVMFAHPHLTF